MEEESKDIEVSTEDTSFGRITKLTVEINAYELLKQNTILFAEEIVRIIAERYVTENFNEIVKHISPEAIANLSIARSAENIAAAINRNADQIRDSSRRKNDTTVIDRGFFRTSIYKA